MSIKCCPGRGLSCWHYSSVVYTCLYLLTYLLVVKTAKASHSSNQLTGMSVSIQFSQLITTNNMRQRHVIIGIAWVNITFSWRSSWQTSWRVVSFCCHWIRHQRQTVRVLCHAVEWPDIVVHLPAAARSVSSGDRLNYHYGWRCGLVVTRWPRST